MLSQFDGVIHRRLLKLARLTEKWAYAAVDFYRAVRRVHQRRLAKQKLRCEGLHQMLTPVGKVSLLVTFSPQDEMPRVLDLIDSCLAQTAPDYEVLIRIPQGASDELRSELQRLAREHPSGFKVSFAAEREAVGKRINLLAAQATGQYLFPIVSRSWLRPDLLYRFHQASLLFSRQKLVLFCNECLITERRAVKRGSNLFKPEHPPFPFVFYDMFEDCLLVSHEVWNSVGGFRQDLDSACHLDLSLRLFAEGYAFQNIPCSLVAQRAGDASPTGLRPATDAGAHVLQQWGERLDRNWSVEVDSKQRYRVRPNFHSAACVHVLVPFKDQCELTQACIEHLRRERNDTEIWITAINNRSESAQSVAKIRALADEVIDADCPFNHSYINNIGLRQSRVPEGFDLLLLLNNDVQLDPGSVREMAAWLQYPEVGVVGAKLRYPNGVIQHGGVAFSRRRPALSPQWYHIDQLAAPGKERLSDLVMVTDSVTAACSMVRKGDFLAIGGFDETLFPVAFNDSDLSLRIRELGKHCLYTPYATGIHFESVSRGANYIEDFESGDWIVRQKSLSTEATSLELL